MLQLGLAEILEGKSTLGISYNLKKNSQYLPKNLSWFYPLTQKFHYVGFTI